MKKAFGVIGMGVMGKSLALNLAEKGVDLSIYNRHVPEKEVGIAQKVLMEFPQFNNILAFDHLQGFVDSLEQPRKILMMIPAGVAIDEQIEELIPKLEKGDVLIDGGNSFYKDTGRRANQLKELGIHFFGAGVSGGEEGARKGPSIMPGGSKEGFAQVKEFFEKIAAKDKNGLPCTAYIGPQGSGHFIKMVHNSIEYSEMQVLGEIYYLLRYHMKMEPGQMIGVFEQWSRDGLESYLLSITMEILKRREGDGLLLDKIADQAAQKGTGSWSVDTALENGVAYGPLAEAVMARIVSSQKKNRLLLSSLYEHSVHPLIEDPELFLLNLKQAYETVRIINHEVGFQLMKTVSDNLHWELDFSEIARIWTNGCIIRSQLMEDLVMIFAESPTILEHGKIVTKLKKNWKFLSETVSSGNKGGFALPVMSSALNYFLGAITSESPANLIQAQRDYFGAHTYKRTDDPSGISYHTEWIERK